MLSSVLKIWSPDNGDGYLLVQDLARIVDDIEDAILSPPYIRVTNTNDLTALSTDHGFQIGPDSGANLAMDTNEIMARNGGESAFLALNRDGGDVYVGDVGSVTYLPGRIDGANYPWAVSAGSYVFNPVASGAVSTVSIPFPAGRFSAIPTVTISAFTVNPQLQSASFSNVSATGMDISYANMGGSTVSTPRIHWQAIQMTPTSGGG